MDPFEIDEDDKYQQLGRDQGRRKREKKIRMHKRRIVEKAIGKTKIRNEFKK